MRLPPDVAAALRTRRLPRSLTDYVTAPVMMGLAEKIWFESPHAFIAATNCVEQPVNFDSVQKISAFVSAKAS